MSLSRTEIAYLEDWLYSTQRALNLYGKGSFSLEALILEMDYLKRAIDKITKTSGIEVRTNHSENRQDESN